MGRTIRSLLGTALLLGFAGPLARAASGDLLWSEARVAGAARQIAVGAGALAVYAVDPSGTSLTIRVYDPATGNLRRSFPRAHGVSDMLVRGGLIVVSEGSDLVAPVNYALKQMEADGSLKAISDKFFSPTFEPPVADG